MKTKHFADDAWADRPLIRAGVPERVAMKISGHKTRAVLDRYNITDERDLHDAARRVEDYLAAKGAKPAGGYKTGTILPETSEPAGALAPKLLN